MTGEQAIGWLALAVQCIRYGVPIIGGVWAVSYGVRGFWRMWG